MNKEKVFKVAAIAIIVASLPVTLLLVKNQQDNRSHAAAADKLETEGGVLGGNAKPQPDSNASGGNYVLFGINQASTPTPTTGGGNCSPIGPDTGGATGVPTYHSLGLYWSPTGGSTSKTVIVKYRKLGDCTWQDGLAMKYYPIPGANTTDYRGSIVNLTPNTSYEIQLTLEGTSTTSVLTTKTWNENPPIGSTVKVSNQSTTYNITQSGTVTGYKVYDGTGSTIDVGKNSDQDITIDASYVIIRGFTLKGAKVDGIRILGGNNIIIEDCDISGWGRVTSDLGFGENYNGGISGYAAGIQRVTVQRCKIHNPTTTANNWTQTWSTTTDTHPRGPQCIMFFNNAGNHVLRYNECWGDLTHHFNDGFGGGDNSDLRGYPGPDSDIYNNYVANTWDDGMEIEGGGRNVRVWNNYVEDAYVLYANASVTVGPLYLFRNVSGKSNGSGSAPPGYFLKSGYSTSQTTMNGPQYLFNNTILQPNSLGAGGLGTSASENGRQVFHTMSRNNLLNVRSGTIYCTSNHPNNIDNNFDFDLCSSAFPPSITETNGILGTPTFANGGTFNFSTMTGDFRLSSTSKGYEKGTPIPNFSNGFNGNAPDIGAQQNNESPMKYGTQSTFTPLQP